MTISARARRDAAEQEDVSQQWRDWCAYLRAQLRLLEVRSASVGRVAFEREESWEEAETAAQADLDAIPIGRRALFEAIRTTRRQQIQHDHELAIRMNGGSRRLIDPDVVDSEALTALLREAEGSTAEDGWGQVPLGTPEQPEWYRVDVAALRDAPSAALYMLGQSAAVDRKRRLMLMGGLAGGCLLLLLAWALWPAAPSRPHTSALVLANGAAIEHMWVPQTLLLRASATQRTTLPISSTTALSWPEAERTEQQALWRVSTVLPLTFCVPQAALPGVTEVQIISAGGAPARRYLLQDNGVGDLRLESCSANHTAALVRYGTLQETISQPDAAVGQHQDVQETQITLSAIKLTGPGEDPSLPAGQVRIRASVVVTGTAALDWPALAPTLLLASGEALLPGDITPHGSGAELTYLAPLLSEPRDLVWMLTPAQTDRPLRWRTTLPPPPSRDAVLRDSLVIDHVAARLETRDRVTITVRMRNRGTVPLTLTATDLTLTHGESPIAGVAITGLTEPIPAGVSRDVSLSLPLSGFNQPLTLALGAQQYRLTLS